MELFIPSFNPSESDEILYQYPTAWPVETALAQTFNTELLEEIGKAVSEEMSLYNITYWLSPGMNIHRNPLCGRNFEYYSEDPLLTAKMAIALLKGITSIPGNYTTIKHFACNNAEDRRSFSDSIVSKRALREIYLKAFELTVKEGEVTGVMTSYNKLNGTYTSDDYELAVSLLRNEWGYKGVLMTDWMSTFEGFGDNVKAIKSGHVMMPGGPYYHEKISEGLKKGTLKEEDLDTVLSYILKAILDSDVSRRIKTEDII